mgnify:CR=1 FL=1
MPVLDDFLSLSRTVGDPALDAAILGEGNTSAALEGGEFLVKASGCTLATMTAEHAVRLRSAPLLDLLDAGPVDETRLQAVYAAAKSDAAQKARPSVEAVFHALLLSYPGVAFGAGGEGSVRICYAAERPILEEGMEKFAKFLSTSWAG